MSKTWLERAQERAAEIDREESELARQLERIATIRTAIEELGEAPTLAKLLRFLAAVKAAVEEATE